MNISLPGSETQKWYPLQGLNQDLSRHLELEQLDKVLLEQEFLFQTSISIDSIADIGYDIFTPSNLIVNISHSLMLLILLINIDYTYRSSLTPIY